MVNININRGLFTAIILTKTTFVEGLTYVKFLCFVPVILGMGGSVGMQASSLTIMTLSNNEENIDFKTVLKRRCCWIDNRIIMFHYNRNNGLFNLR